MKEFTISFMLGILFTVLLFVICFLTVVGAKSVYSAIKKIFPEKTAAEPPEEKPATPKKPRAPKSPSVIRTIEIDPSQVDRIYVKKAQ